MKIYARKQESGSSDVHGASVPRGVQVALKGRLFLLVEVAILHVALGVFHDDLDFPLHAG